MRVRNTLICVKLAVLWPVLASAHVAEQGFVLLLPTGAYSAAGVAVVVLTILALVAAPAHVVHRLFQARRFAIPSPDTLRIATSLVSFIVFAGLIHIGLRGPRDPLSNLLPLTFWTMFWIGLVTLAGFAGNLWHWVNPWSGVYRFIAPERPRLSLPNGLGVWPALIILLLFSAFLLADIAPDDPARLAYVLASYWALTLLGMMIFGPAWLDQSEAASVMFRLYGDLAAPKTGQAGGIGFPGWRLLDRRASLSIGAFAVALLGIGSFDGVNETFWWLAQIGVNPLEFPGRSAVIVPTLMGLVASVLGLLLIFVLTVWAGLKLAGSTDRSGQATARLALSLLPIAFGYHIAHYLTAFLVNAQYTVAALSDPLANGADFLRIEPFYVTTGFFNHLTSVRLIWLTQAGAVVIGHIWAVLLAHRIATDLFPNGRKAAIATAPLSIFMIGYTFLGLWLLAAPRGA